LEWVDYLAELESYCELLERRLSSHNASEAMRLVRGIKGVKNE
jgi:hypothetical protein